MAKEKNKSLKKMSMKTFDDEDYCYKKNKRNKKRHYDDYDNEEDY